jgi:hypothetical protein
MFLEAAIAAHPLRLGRPPGGIGARSQGWLEAQIGMPTEQSVAPDGSTADFNAAKVADEGMGPLVAPATKPRWRAPRPRAMRWRL